MQEKVWGAGKQNFGLGKDPLKHALDKFRLCDILMS